MAIVIVQSNAQVDPGDTVSLLNPVGSGNLVIVGLVTFNAPGIITSVNDSRGNVYLPISGTDQAMGLSGSSMWYCANVTGGPTAFQLNHTGNSISEYVTEISGAHSVPIDDSGGVSANGQPVGPNLTATNSGDLLLAICGTDLSGNTGVNAPWSTLTGPSTTPVGDIFAYYFPGSTGTFQATFTPTQTSNFASSGVAIQPVLPLSLTLTDSISSSDSTVKEDNKTITDSVTMVDSVNQARAASVSDSLTVIDSFILQSDFVAPIRIPVVEQLVNQLAPAEVKTYFKIQ